MAYVGVSIPSGSNNGGATTIACGARTVVAGNLLVVVVGNETGGPVYASGIADLAGNVYVSIGNNSTSGDSCEMWYAKNITGYTNNVVTATFPGNATYRRICCMEFSDCDTTAPFTAGEYNTGTANSGTALATGTFATATADSVIVQGGFHGTAHSFVPGTDGVVGHTFIETYDAADYYCCAGYYIEASTGSGYKGQATAPGSGNWAIVAAAFKMAGGATNISYMIFES